MPIRPARLRASLARTFGRCFLLAAALFLPFLIIDKGFFLYCGDFNSQQIPFTYYMEGLIKNGLPSYAWATDLGSGFLESYSFYLLGSPFFWLGCLLPQAWSPYLMVPLLCLKFAVAGTGAQLWARRYTRTTYAAELVAILYAFSGFSIYNIFFNHFLDVVAVFPFLLWSVDEFYENDRRAVFPLMTALCLFVNYFFFVGQVVFIVLYFFLRVLGDDWRPSLKKFGVFCLEAVLGVGLAMVMALPSGLSVLRNPRVDSFSTGLDMLFYWRTQQYLAIFTSAFLPQDPSYLPNLFPDCSIKWTSMSLYLPLTGMAGVLTWLKNNKKHTVRRLLLTCAVMALVPVLNAAFYAFNSTYYCRWYYLPLLFMALATACALEEAPREDWLRSTRLCGAITAGYLVFALLPDKNSDGSFKLGIEDDPLRFAGTLALALGSVALLYWLLKHCRSRAGLLLRVASFAAMFGVITGIYTVACGKFPQRSGDADYKLECYDYRQELKTWLDNADENYYRIDAYESYINLGLWLDRSCLQFFNSTVDASIMQFYPMVGVKRDVSSKPEAKNYALRGLLNVRYLLLPSDRLEDFNTGVGHPDDWSFAAEIGPYTILEYRCYVPFGTAYEYYITQEQYESLSEGNRANLLLRALVLSEEQIAQYGDRLRPLSDAGLSVATYAAYAEDCSDRSATACSSFTASGSGFDAVFTADAPQLVFFAIPYNDAWQVTVNGQPVTVENVDDGLCAIPVEAGESVIHAEYHAVGLKTGRTVSLVCAVLWAVYALGCAVLRTRQSRAGLRPRPLPLLDLTPAEEADALPAWLPPDPPKPADTVQEEADAKAPCAQAGPADAVPTDTDALQTADDASAMQEAAHTGEAAPAAAPTAEGCTPLPTADTSAPDAAAGPADPTAHAAPQPDGDDTAARPNGDNIPM